MRNLVRWFLSLVMCFAIALPAFAVNPDEVLDDPVLEERARKLSVEIRCLVCQNQSIDDSDAELARDLRILVREKLVEGLEDKEILDFLVARYGEFVLLKPPVSSRTYVLWAMPFVLLGIGGVALVLFAKRTKPVVVSSELSEDEKQALSRILDEK